MNEAAAVDDNEELRQGLHELRGLLLPRRPSGAAWVRMKHHGDTDVEIWQQPPLRVVSSIERGKDPHWHLTVMITGSKRRASAVEMQRVKRAFGMLSAAEDTRLMDVRHLYLRVTPVHRVESGA